MMVAIRLRMRTGSDAGSPPSRVDWPIDLAHRQAAAVEQQRARLPQWSRPPFVVDPRRAAHLAAGHQQDLVAQAARFQVFDERRHRVVERPAHVAHALGRRRRC